MGLVFEERHPETEKKTGKHMKFTKWWHMFQLDCENYLTTSYKCPNLDVPAAAM